MTVGDLLARMGPQEFNRWKRFYAVEPFGPWRDDLRVGRLCALTANINRAEGADVRTSADYMWNYEDAREKTPQEVEQKIRAAFAHLIPAPAPHDVAKGS